MKNSMFLWHKYLLHFVGKFLSESGEEKEAEIKEEKQKVEKGLGRNRASSQ